MQFTPKNHYNKQELIACAQGEMFGKGNAQLPMDQMLMVDRIVEICAAGGKYGAGFVIAELDINPDLWFFDCHFKGDPVMPGCLGVDAMWQLLGFYLGWRGAKGRGRALGCGKVKFSGQVLPTHKKVVYQIDIKKVIMRQLVLGVADGVLSVDGQEIYTGVDMQVGLFGDKKLF